MATGHYDENGFWFYGEDDLADEGQGFSTVLNKSSEAVRAAVPVLVHNRVVDELAADGTIREAAADAVTEEIAGRSLVETTDTRLAQDIGDVPGWVSLEVTEEGWVISGERTDGTVYNYYDSVRPAITLPATDVPGWQRLVFDATGQYVVEGDRASDGALFLHRLVVGHLEAPDISRRAAVASYTDSMGGDHGNTSTSTNAQLGIELGIPAYQGGVPGQTLDEIAFRLGAYQLPAVVVGKSIPVAGAVEVGIKHNGFWATGAAWEFDVTARVRTIASGAATVVPGALRKAVDNTWTFTAAAGLAAPVAAPLEVLFISTEAQYSDRGIVFRGGRNNKGLNDPNFLDNVARVHRDARAFVYANQARPRFLAVSVYNPRSATSGTADYATYMAANAAIARECPGDYYDLRGWMIRNGLAATGINPTAQDTADIAADTIPTSLSYVTAGGVIDGTHLSPAARITEARQLAFVLTQKGWFTS